MRAGVPTPEHINDGYETKPSRRLETLLEPGYKKTRHGPLGAQEIGGTRVPHFKAWMDKPRGLAGGGMKLQFDVGQSFQLEAMAAVVALLEGQPDASMSAVPMADDGLSSPALSWQGSASSSLAATGCPWTMVPRSRT